MRRSLFTRVVVILMTVLLVGISITGAVFWLFMEQRAVADKAASLRQSGARIVDTLKIYLENQDSVLAPLLFRSFLDSVGGNAASMIWIAMDDGTLVMTSDLPDWVTDRLESSARAATGCRTSASTPCRRKTARMLAETICRETSTVFSRERASSGSRCAFLFRTRRCRPMASILRGL